MKQNNIAKYFKYAIGEILLVMIGILLALQVNNWNTKRQQENTEEIILIALQEEFVQNKNKLNEVIELNESNIEGAKKMIEAFQSNISDTISEKTIALNTYQAYGIEINFTPYTGVLSEIISSGDLKIIENQDLKHKLAAFGSWIDRIKQQEGEVTAHRTNIIEYMRDHGNVKTLFVSLGADLNLETPLDSVDNRFMVNSIDILNRVVLFQRTSMITTREFYLPFNEEVEEILNLIISEVKNK